ncbi:Elongation of very long chain fatty acids protein 6-like [Danio rerio]|uniref:Elongation of very long chain fatty acids protein n=1 Tax=Danio rerio TaxID=7955 RepID=Q6DGW0_DANRE|nr:Elongation of very long chain fatty acids protein 6-like [Danio rerio]AAH76227.1 Zgc:92749 [Danio rerio]|eukprot:NP_001002570.1 zgc:92749 [Danio rerio]
MNGSLSAFAFERQFDDRGALLWFQQNWGYSFVLSGTYAVLIFLGHMFMKDRQKLDLRAPLVLWSMSLAVFSIVGTLRTGWYMFNVVCSEGFRQSVCDTDFYSAPVSKFWAFAFAISKAPELGDTVFVVLRKQRLIFLHWYHHITVLLYSWFSYKDHVAGGGWFMSMNFTVHAFMYSYYTAKAAGVRVPRAFAMLITVLQISQMAAGLTVLGLVYSWKHEQHCKSTDNNIIFGSAMYFSYLPLFCAFFYQSYIRRSDGGQKRRLKRD